jgi:hypothetical protein
MSERRPLAPQHAIDYDVLLSGAKDHGAFDAASFLQQRLPSTWRDAYLSTISHEPNLVRFRHRTFVYICDLYSQLEVTGSVPYDQTIADRVIGVFGTSSSAQEHRNAKRQRIGLSEELEGAARDDGHFIARSIGGGLDVNLFSQERLLNRGWSPQGKVYRRMERYCCEQEGTFCFSRPIYTDESNVPRWLEFGVLKSDETLWVEVFDN